MYFRILMYYRTCQRAFMPILSALTPFTLLAVNPSLVSAGNPCEELLRHGIYDTYAKTESALTYSEAREDLCKSYDSINRMINDGSGGLNIIGIAKINGGLTKEELAVFRQAMCAKEYDLQTLEGDRDVFRRTLNSRALKVVERCVDAANAGIILELLYPDEDTFVLSIYFRSPVPGTKGRAFTAPPSVPSTLNCEGPLLRVKKDHLLGNSVLGMTCRRAGSTDPSSRLAHAGGLVTLYTTAKTVLALMPMKPRPNRSNFKYLSDDSPDEIVKRVHGGVGLDRPYWGDRIIVGGIHYPRGIVMHPPEKMPAIIKYRIPEGFKRFQATIALAGRRCDPAGGSPGSAIFSASVDDSEKYRSERIEHGVLRRIDIDVFQAETLILQTEDAGDGKRCDHAVWLNARVVRE